MITLGDPRVAGLEVDNRGPHGRGRPVRSDCYQVGASDSHERTRGLVFSQLHLASSVRVRWIVLADTTSAWSLVANSPGVWKSIR